MRYRFLVTGQYIPAQVAMGEEQVDVLVTGIFTAQNVVDI